MAPGKKGISKLTKHKKANTLYLSIPADLTKEKGFPFKDGDKVQLDLNIENQTIVISKFE